MIFIAGLILIIAGWAVQAYKTLAKKKRDLTPVLPALYGLGCILLLAGNFMANDIITGVLNAVCAVLATALFAVLLTWRKPA
jgi:hypothetical protein